MTLGVGVIGLGVGVRHAAAFAAHPDCRLVALCDRDPARAEIARQFPGARFSTSAEELIDDPSIDVLAIASWDDAHYAQLLRALAAGKHAFVEKPLCLRETELADIAARLKAAPRLQVSSNLILRMSPRFRDLKRRVAGGEYGRLFYLEGDYDYGRLAKLTDGWRGGIAEYSVMLGGGVHVVDLLLWLAQGVRVKTVAAMGNRISSGAAQTRFAGPDLVAALLQFEDGCIAKVTANFGSVRPHFHRLMVYGTAATFENGPDEALQWASRDPAMPPKSIDLAYPGADKGALIPSFVDSILGRGDADVTTREVLDCMAVCFAIERALREGGVATVRYV